MRYRVTVLMEWPNSGRRFPMERTVSAPNAREAITVACKNFQSDGWPGPFLFGESENVDDGHDVWKAAW